MCQFYDLDHHRMYFTTQPWQQVNADMCTSCQSHEKSMVPCKEELMLMVSATLTDRVAWPSLEWSLWTSVMARVGRQFYLTGNFMYLEKSYTHCIFQFQLFIQVLEKNQLHILYKYGWWLRTLWNFSLNCSQIWWRGPWWTWTRKRPWPSKGSWPWPWHHARRTWHSW